MRHCYMYDNFLLSCLQRDLFFVRKIKSWIFRSHLYGVQNLSQSNPSRCERGVSQCGYVRPQSLWLYSSRLAKNMFCMCTYFTALVQCSMCLFKTYLCDQILYANVLLAATFQQIDTYTILKQINPSLAPGNFKVLEPNRRQKSAKKNKRRCLLGVERFCLLHIKFILKISYKKVP